MEREWAELCFSMMSVKSTLYLCSLDNQRRQLHQSAVQISSFPDFSSTERRYLVAVVQTFPYFLPFWLGSAWLGSADSRGCRSAQEGWRCETQSAHLHWVQSQSWNVSLGEKKLTRRADCHLPSPACLWVSILRVETELTDGNLNLRRPSNTGFNTGIWR